MPGTARRLTIAILSVLLVVLVVVAVIIFLNSRNQVQPIVNGAVCTAGAAMQCEGSSANGNTGNLCTCQLAADGTNRWSCATRDTLRCPLPQSAACQPGATQTGQCGSNNCLGSQRPVQTCGADGTFGAATCVTDTTCQTDGEGPEDPDLNCQISGDNNTLSISNNCPTDFSYLVRLHVVENEEAVSDADCRTATSQNPQIINAKPGDNLAIDISDYSCGQCVRYELTQTPTSAFIRAATAYAFTGVCGGTANPSQSSTQSSITSSPTNPIDDEDDFDDEDDSFTTTSSPASNLPDTGLFDDPNNYPLLFGLGLIVLGLSVNRFSKLAGYLSYTDPKNYESSVETKSRKR